MIEIMPAIEMNEAALIQSAAVAMPLAIAGTPGLSNSCGGTFTPAATAGGTALNLSGASIPAGISCTITVNVTSTTLGTATNTTGNVTSNEGGAGNAASADLSVVASAPPQISKAFSPATIPSGGVSTMTITIVNPLDSRVTLQCTIDGGIALSDIDGERELSGTCGGGAKAHGHIKPEGTRKANWRDKPVELVRTVLDLTVTGASSGQIHQINEVPKDSTVGSFPLYTSIDVNTTAQGISLAEKLERHVLPKVKG